VSADRSKSLAPFEDNLLLGSSQRNVMVSENRGINVDGWISGGWYLVMGVSQAEQKSEQGVVNQPDQRTDNGSLGVRYVTAAGNSITATQRTAKGDYLNQSAVPNVTGTGFHENETSLATIWRFTEKSELQARVARLERSNNDVGQRDFSGPASELSYTWKATNKLSLNIAANQSKQALQDPSFSYAAVSGVSIAPTWQISEKVSSFLRLSRAESKYRGSGPVPATGPAREDTTNSAELGLGWAPLRNLTVNSSLQRQKRTSNQAGAEFDDNLASVNASWLFW
jgi:hypothetical protein